MLAIYLKVLLSLLPVLLSLSKDLRAYFVLSTGGEEWTNFIWPCNRCHCHVFWSFDPSFLLNQWSCVVCSLCIISGHPGIRWCAVGKPWAGLGLEPSGPGPVLGPGCWLYTSPSSCVPGLSEYLLVDAWMGCKLWGPGSHGLFHILKWNWKKITPNCRT